jgi:hypothetical protein
MDRSGSDSKRPSWKRYAGQYLLTRVSQELLPWMRLPSPSHLELGPFTPRRLLPRPTGRKTLHHFHRPSQTRIVQCVKVICHATPQKPYVSDGVLSPPSKGRSYFAATHHANYGTRAQACQPSAHLSRRISMASAFFSDVYNGPVMHCVTSSRFCRDASAMGARDIHSAEARFGDEVIWLKKSDSSRNTQIAGSTTRRRAATSRSQT